MKRFTYKGACIEKIFCITGREIEGFCTVMRYNPDSKKYIESSYISIKEAESLGGIFLEYKEPTSINNSNFVKITYPNAIERFNFYPEMDDRGYGYYNIFSDDTCSKVIGTGDTMLEAWEDAARLIKKHLL